ncbi:MAG: hypothetical protein ACFFDQ_12740 [Candidatus Thorarchaeota archaeon]
MDILSWVVLVTVVLLAAAFNYYLNLAPGADPEDFQVGPPQLGITCDCPLNIIIIGGIIALALSAVSGFFNSRTELIIAGIISFSLITIAGYIGRNRRHKEWKELHKAIERSIPSTAFVGYQRAPTDITFEDEDDEDFDEYFDEY